MKALLLVTATLPEPSTAWMNHSTLVPRAAPRHSSAASCATSRSTAKPAVVVTPRLRPPCFRALWVRRPSGPRARARARPGPTPAWAGKGALRGPPAVLLSQQEIPALAVSVRGFEHDRSVEESVFAALRALGLLVFVEQAKLLQGGDPGAAVGRVQRFVFEAHADVEVARERAAMRRRGFRRGLRRPRLAGGAQCP